MECFSHVSNSREISDEPNWLMLVPVSPGKMVLLKLGCYKKQEL
jgi:hypothetical protein